VSALRLLVVSPDAAFAGAVRGIFAAQLAEAACEMLDPGTLRSRPVADGLVIDGRADVARGAELAARMRAMGFAGALVVVSSEGAGNLGPALAATGAAHAAAREIGGQLVPALAERLAEAESEHAAEVMRARRLIAAGQIAIGFQHSLNNPLAGILAEAQLMQLDTMPPEQHAALERIVALCRRIIELGRALDGMGERK
jgi:signal transduction histidine kinase